MFFNTYMYNNLMKIKTNMIILILLLQGTRSLTQDLVDFRGELGQISEKSKADRQRFESSSYTVFQFTGVYPNKDVDLINLCSNACLSTSPNDELTIIQIKKRMSCKKTHKEQMSDIILCLQKCLNGSNGREVFTADHQLSMHVVARSNLRNFVEINDEVNKIVSFESLVHYIYVNSIKLATIKSLVALLDSIIKMAFNELKDNIPSLTLRQAEKQDKNFREYQVTIFNCMVKYLSGQDILSHWSGKLRLIHYKYQFSCSETWISKLCLYKEYEKSWMVTLEKEFKIYKDAETENTMKYVDRQILPLILPNLIKKVIDGNSTLFVESFEAIFRKICCEYNATINKDDAIKDILENNRGKIEDSIRKYLSMIGFTRYLDSYKYNNFSKIGHKLNQMYGFNSLKIVCNTRLKMADLTQLSYILSDIEHVFADEKNHMLYIDMTKLVDPQLFFTDVFTPVLINRASTTSNKISVIGPAYRLKMITKPAHQSDANYVEFFRYGVMKEYNCGKEKRFYSSSRKFGWHNNSSVTSKQIQPKLLQMYLECNNPDNLLKTNYCRDNNSKIPKTLKIVLFNDSNSYEILVNPNFTADGIVESLDVSHNLPHQILTNRWNQLYNPKQVDDWIIYDKITSPQFLVALKCYLSTMVQLAEFIEIPVIHYDGANDCYLEQVDILGYDKPITTYNECCTATLLEVNQKLFPQKASGKVAVNHPLVLTYTLVLTRNCGGLIYHHELVHFAKSHGIDAKKLRDVIDALIIDEKYLNVTNDSVVAHFKHECRQIYVHAVIASDAKAYLYIIRDFVEKEYNYFSTYFLLEMHTKCQEDSDIRQSIPALQNIVGFEIKICPITVIFITLLRLRINNFDDLQEQLDKCRDAFDEKFCEAIWQHRKTIDRTGLLRNTESAQLDKMTKETLRANTTGYDKVHTLVSKILVKIKECRAKTLKACQTKVIRVSRDEINDLKSEVETQITSDS